MTIRKLSHAGLVAAAGGTIASLVMPATPSAAATGRRYTFYNADVCNDINASSLCIYTDTDNMTKGTLKVQLQSIRWRGGSGDGTTTNRCIDNAGPIPRDTFFFQSHEDHKPGNKIFGRAWWLTDTVCKWHDPGSEDRTELFIHTEETSDNKQSRTQESKRWDGDNDYHSDGCIKVSYKHMGEVDGDWHSHTVTQTSLNVDA